FEAADGYVVIAVGTEALWERFTEAIERPELRDDPRFATNADRVEHRDELAEFVQGHIGSHPVDALVDDLAAHDVPATPVLDMGEVFDHPQIHARGMHQTLEHPTIGSVEMPGSPMHLSATPTEMRRAAPLLGEHTGEVLAEAGYDEEELAALAEDAIICGYQQG
ncbi:MAG: CoA transferase, partial [Halobacteriota archaeon]